MNAITLSGLLILVIFYAAFFIKMMMMKQRGLVSNLLGKGQKPEKARRVERWLQAVTYGGACFQFASPFLGGIIWGPPLPPGARVTGLALAAIGAVVFIMAMINMKNNWRSGCDQSQNTSLVTGGLYRVSRNPAFVGFDLLYLGWALAFPNIISGLIAAAVLIIFNMQIVEEEKFLEAAFGRSYLEYKARVNRYFGRKPQR